MVASGNSAILSWRNPSFDAQGKALTELTGIKIYRGEELVTTVTVSSDKTGQSMEYTDENLQDGLYSYRFVPVNSKGDGGVDSDDVSTYVGENAPGKVVDFVVKQGDNEAILTWKGSRKICMAGRLIRVVLRNMLLLVPMVLLRMK